MSTVYSTTKEKPRFDEYMASRAAAAIAQGALTNSKRPQSFIRGVFPTHLSKSLGAYAWDTNGNKYIDYIAGLGSSTLGHCNEQVTNAVVQQAWRGHTLSLGTELEIEVAEKIKELIPFVERVKFLKSGTDATTAAVKIARAFTGKNVVISEGYHGWSDVFTTLTPPAHGVPYGKNSAHLPPGEIDFGEWDWDVAAVIVEPIITDTSSGRIDRLKYLRDVCTKHGALLIFDEIITGFRYPSWCASNYYNITPDLI